MKTTILSLLLVILAGCSNDNITKDPIFQLPPETQTGANTFGVTIRGKVYVPRDPTGVDVGVTPKGMIFWGTSDDSWNEIEIKDGASSVGFKMIIHIQNLVINGVSQYVLHQSNFQNGLDSTPFTHIYFKIWDNTISNYAYYGSIENQGEITVSKFNGSLSTNWILSGTFKGKFERKDNPNEFIQINDGRFDLNLNTLPNNPFP